MSVRWQWLFERKLINLLVNFLSELVNTVFRRRASDGPDHADHISIIIMIYWHQEMHKKIKPKNNNREHPLWQTKTQLITRLCHISRAARKSRKHDYCEQRDFGRVPWFLAIAVILRNGRDYLRTMYTISTVQLQLGCPVNGGINLSQGSDWDSFITRNDFSCDFLQFDNFVLIFMAFCFFVNTVGVAGLSFFYFTSVI